MALVGTASKHLRNEQRFDGGGLAGDLIVSGLDMLVGYITGTVLPATTTTITDTLDPVSENLDNNAGNPSFFEGLGLAEWWGARGVQAGSTASTSALKGISKITGPLLGATAWPALKKALKEVQIDPQRASHNATVALGMARDVLAGASNQSELDALHEDLKLAFMGLDDERALLDQLQASHTRAGRRFARRQFIIGANR